MEEFLNINPGSFEDIIGAISPAIYENLKQAYLLNLVYLTFLSQH